MPAELVKRAIEQSREADPSVGTMALLHSARVLAVVDKEAAKQAFGEGVGMAENLPLDGRPLEFLLTDAVEIGATADPPAAVALFRRLPPAENHFHRRSTGARLVQSLAQSGDFEIAVGLLEDLDLEVGGAQIVAHLAPDAALQRRVMFAAYTRWQALRKQPDTEKYDFEQREFYPLFSRHWRKLELSEAETWLKEILLAVESDADQPARADFMDRVTLHSRRDMHLFQILNVLGMLKPPEQVEGILQAHPDVAAAARVYPLGMESLMAQQRPAPKTGGGGVGFAYGGSGRDRRSVASLMAAHSGDPLAVEDMLSEAHRLYAEDTEASDPNAAPRIFWPSLNAYKVALYWAGKLLREEEAEQVLARIPVADFALLASIELVAGALGLQQHSGLRMEHHPNRMRRRSAE